MKLRIRNRPNFFAGLMFSVVGAGANYMASRYQIGTAAQMGPGYFPLMLGGLLAFFGLVIAVRSLTMLDEEEKIAPITLRPVLLVFGSVSLFGALLMTLGLVFASFVLVTVSALASDEFDWKVTISTAVVLIIGSYVIFVYGLGLPMPVWPGGR